MNAKASLKSAKVNVRSSALSVSFQLLVGGSAQFNGAHGLGIALQLHLGHQVPAPANLSAMNKT